jgi:hypothetical protein
MKNQDKTVDAIVVVVARHLWWRVIQTAFRARVVPIRTQAAERFGEGLSSRR